MELPHRTVAALRHLRDRIRAWRDAIAVHPVDRDRWLR